ncbi:hypothetical protein NKJ46_22380 [Mesorhizobium sp. M0166]|uniref:hypothetical protein n=1 Tax=Mesorhizobium sp. M0166 TaxID=2956902 RepID=UPI0033371FA8
MSAIRVAGLPGGEILAVDMAGRLTTELGRRLVTAKRQRPERYRTGRVPQRGALIVEVLLEMAWRRLNGLLIIGCICWSTGVSDHVRQVLR